MVEAELTQATLGTRSILRKVKTIHEAVVSMNLLYYIRRKRLQTSAQVLCWKACEKR